MFMYLRLLNGGVGAASFHGLVMFDLAAIFNHHSVWFLQKSTSKDPASRQDLQLITDRAFAGTLDLTPLRALTS